MSKMNVWWLGRETSRLSESPNHQQKFAFVNIICGEVQISQVELAGVIGAFYGCSRLLHWGFCVR